MTARSASSATAALLISLSSLPAFGPPAADPVVTNFLAYRAAVERKDFAAAETAAAAAYAASEAANGSRTAVLALNLATLRLSLAEPARALPPAARAHELATAGRDTGVDPLLASLTLGRAELAASVATGAERTAAAIKEAEARKAFLSESYVAAVALGDWTTTQEQFDASREAWVTAERLAEGASDPVFARGRARFGEGVAIILGGINQARGASARNSAKVAASADAHAADAALSEAQRLLRRYAFPEQPPAALTPGQTLYAQAMAWQGALRARLESQDQELRKPFAIAGHPLQRSGAPPACFYRTTADLPAYPADALNRLGAGAVVLHSVFDERGNAVRREVAAGVPTGSFVEAIRRSIPAWTEEIAPESAKDCDPSGSRYALILFLFEDL